MNLKDYEKGGILQVIDFTGDPVRSSPLMELMNERFEKFYMVAPAGVSVGDLLEYGESVPPKAGNVTNIENVVEGTPIYNLEIVRGDGGKLVRASGLAAYVMAQDKERKKTLTRLPSKHKVEMDWGCRVTVGVIAAGGRSEKPFVKAGNRSKDQRSRGKLYPKTSGTAMNAIDHPFGGRTNLGKQTSRSRNAPPGQKVGKIAPRRTGVRKSKVVKV